MNLLMMKLTSELPFTSLKSFLESLFSYFDALVPRDKLLIPRGHLRVQVATSGLKLLLLSWLSLIEGTIIITPNAYELKYLTSFIGLETKALIYSPNKLNERVEGIKLEVGSPLHLQKLLKTLEGSGYRLTETLSEPGEVLIRGLVLEIFPLGATFPIRITLDDDLVERITIIDPSSYFSLEKLQEVIIPLKGDSLKLVDTLKEPELLIYPSDLRELSKRFPNSSKLEILSLPLEDSISLGDRWPAPLGLKLSFLMSYLKEWVDKGYRVLFASSKPDVLRNLLGEETRVLRLSLPSGFLLPSLKLLVLSDKELGATPSLRGDVSLLRTASITLDDLTDIREGDLVSHPRWGVAIYRGIVKLESDGVLKDWILLEFKGGERFYLAPEDASLKKLNVIGPPEKYLTRLGKVRKRIEEDETLAKRLLQIAHLRSSQEGVPMHGDEELEREFWNTFPYRETKDQLRATEEILRDMEMGIPMERLLIGDTGFGKTEVYLRGAFRAISSGYQVWLILPTSTLYVQQLRRVKERMEPFGVRVAGAMRGIPRSLREKLKRGEVDILVSTPVNFSSLEFKRLGLIIVDEEHLLGVRYKESLKEKWPHVHLLYSSATPIPRTLFLALSGIIGISALKERPSGIGEVDVELLPHNPERASQLIASTLKSGYKVVYLYNRVQDLPDKALELSENLGNLDLGDSKPRIAILHGKTPKKEMERILLDFLRGKVNLLVTTTVLQAGIDVPDIALMYVERPDLMGIATLYQLRGRLARGSVQRSLMVLAFDPDTPDTSLERLRLFQRVHNLGAFEIAKGDLHWRGAGKILSKKQHGKLEYRNYHLLLKATSGYSPLPSFTHPYEAYLPDSPAKMRLYNLLARVRREEDLRVILQMIEDVYGKRFPKPLENLILTIKAKLLAMEKGIHELLIRRSGELVIKRYSGEPESLVFKLRAKGSDALRETLEILRSLKN